MDIANKFEHLLRIFGRMHSLCMRSSFDKAGLDELSNPEILFYLCGREPGEAVTQKELADSIGISPPTAAVSIKRMERAGLLNKLADPQDLRKNRITLTDKGWQLTHRCMETGAKIHQEVLKGLTQEELSTMCDCYIRMIRNMQNAGIRLPVNFEKKVEL